jgi:hypothetical protein
MNGASVRGGERGFVTPEYFHGRFPFDFAPGRLSGALRVAGKPDGRDGMRRIKDLGSAEVSFLGIGVFLLALFAGWFRFSE